MAASWGPLGPSWRPLGASWRPRPTTVEGNTFFGGLLGASWPRFSKVFGCHFGSQNRSKSSKNLISKGSKKKIDFQDHFFIDFGSILGARTAQDGPRRSPKGAKTAPRGLQKTDCRLHFSALAAKSPQGPPGTPPRTILGPFLIDFGAHFRSQKSIKIFVKIIPQKASKRYRFSDPFLSDFGSILDARTSQPRVEITPSYASILRFKAAKTTPEHTHTSTSFSFLSSLLRGGFSSAGVGGRVNPSPKERKEGYRNHLPS